MHFTQTLKRHQFTPGAAPRMIHLVDAENLIGSPKFSVAHAREIRRAYAAIAPSGAVDMTVLATSHFAAAKAWIAWPAATRRLVRSGADGADLALLEVIGSESLHLRFDRVVIGSGDGIFALAASRLQQLGCPVTIISRRGGLSRQLRLAVRDVRLIDGSLAAAALGFPLERAA